MARKEKPRGLDILVGMLLSDKNLVEEVRGDPVNTINKLAQKIKDEHPVAPSEDKFIYRLVVIVLGIIVLSVLGLVGVKYSLMNISDVNAHLYVPEILVAVGSTALGALAGLLAPQVINGQS
jgi:hypothetical protein